MVKVDINKLMKYPSRVSKELGTIDLSDDQDINVYIEEVMMINEEANLRSFHWTNLYLSSKLYHLHSSMLFLIRSRKNW